MKIMGASFELAPALGSWRSNARETRGMEE